MQIKTKKEGEGNDKCADKDKESGTLVRNLVPLSK